MTMSKFGILVLLSMPVVSLAQTESEERANDAKQRAMERLERKYEVQVESAVELAELAKALEANSIELIELQNGLAPAVQHRIRQALVLDDRPVIGVSIGPLSGASEVVKGVGVLGVTPGGPADIAGVETGDLIVKIDDLSLAADDSEQAQRALIEYMRERKAGEPVALSIDRDGRMLTAKVTPKRGVVRSMSGVIPAHPVAPFPPDGVFEFESFSFPGQNGFAFLSGAQRHWEGIELIELTPGLGRYFGTDEGLLVVRIPENDKLPLAEGDVIRSIDGREPKSVSQAIRILRSYDAGDSFKVDVLRDRKKRSLDVQIPESEKPGLAQGQAGAT